MKIRRKQALCERVNTFLKNKKQYIIRAREKRIAPCGDMIPTQHAHGTRANSLLLKQTKDLTAWFTRLIDQGGHGVKYCSKVADCF